MAKKIIPVKGISDRHQHGLICTTDSDYASFATKLYRESEDHQKNLHMTDKEMTELITNLTLYYEDIVAECGIWAGFVKNMQKQYGKILPFYPLDDKSYDTGEPHIEDIQFIIWLTLTKQHSERILYPKSPIIQSMAQAVFYHMDNDLDIIPINDDLKDFFAKATFADKFYDMREVMKWFLFDCYISGNTLKNLNLCAHVAQTWAKSLNIEMPQAFYLAECNVPFKLKTGPMALTPQEWLGQTLRVNGQEEIADKIENVKTLEFSAYQILKAKQGEDFQLMSIKNDVFNVSAPNMGNPKSSDYQAQVVIGSFAKYGDEWFLNGDSFWSTHKEIYDRMKRDNDTQDPIEDKHVTELLKAENGQRLYFFKDYHDYAEFLINRLHFTQANVDKLKIEIEEKNIALYIGTKGQLMTMPNGARCICSKQNPFYDKATAQKDALTVVLTCPPEFAEYLIVNHLLPDAALNSHEGEEQGNAIVQDNFDFLVKTFRPQDF